MLTDRRKLPRTEGVIFFFFPSLFCKKYFQENRATFPSSPTCGSWNSPVPEWGCAAPLQSGFESSAQKLHPPGQILLLFTHPWFWGKASLRAPALFAPSQLLQAFQRSKCQPGWELWTWSQHSLKCWADQQQPEPEAAEGLMHWSTSQLQGKQAAFHLLLTWTISSSLNTVTQTAIFAFNCLKRITLGSYYLKWITESS